jgi:hypothetical protein
MMNESDRGLFSASELLRFTAIARQHEAAAAQAPLLLVFAFVSLAGVCGVVVLEWEIVFRVFAYLNGDGASYWSPELMASGAAVIVVGFHLLARLHPRSIAVRLLNASVPVLIPAYLLGTGLLIAGILYADGLGEMAAPQALPVFGLPSEPPAHDGGSWLKEAFERFATPLGVLIFAIGIGGLSICNVYVAHRLLSLSEEGALKARIRMRRASDARKAMRAIKLAQQRHAELRDQLAALDARWDAPGIHQALTCEVASVIAQNLQPWKAWLAERVLQPEARFTLKEGLDPKAVAAQVARIEAISPADIRRALEPQLQGEA